MYDEHSPLSTNSGSQNTIPPRPYKQRSVKAPRLSHHRHTGRWLHVRHTSYALLFFILVLVGVFLIFTGQKAADAADQVKNASVSLSGTYYGEPPTTPATIDTPSNNAVVDKNILTVSGTCEVGYIVEIYRGNTVAGTIICSSLGQYSVQITVVPGKNILVVKTKNGANEYGPDSSQVVVNYKIEQDTKSSTTPLENKSDLGESQTGGAANEQNIAPLLIYVAPVQLGIQPESLLTLEYEINGGKPAYALSINWGDGSDFTIKPHDQEGDFTEQHTYEEAGQYTVTLFVQDSLGSNATIQTIVIVNGQPRNDNSILSPIANDCSSENGTDNSIACTIISSVNVIWPAFLIATTMTLSFWLGEKVVYWRISHNNISQN